MNTGTPMDYGARGKASHLLDELLGLNRNGDRPDAVIKVRDIWEGRRGPPRHSAERHHRALQLGQTRIIAHPVS